MKNLAWEKINGFYQKRRRMPSYSEIATLLGFQSKNAAYKVVNKLMELGFVERDQKGTIVPKKLLSDTKILGLVEAGFPSPAEEELVDTVSIDEYLIDKKEATYLLQVKGDSMINAGIHEGDLVLAERGRQPKINDIVIAEVDGDWTMKYYQKKNGKIVLEPANPKYKTIIPSEELKIAAVVVGVIRKYK